MKRGTVWTAAAGGTYAGKPRPVVVVQDDRFDSTDSITVVPATSDPVEASFRVVIRPSEGNGLRLLSRLMVDKVTTIRREALGRKLGVLAPEDMRRVDQAVLTFLGLVP